MTRSNRSMELDEFVDRLMREVIHADAQAQILQQKGWIDFQRFKETKEGFDLTEGIGQMEYLGLREVRLTFAVEPVQPGFWGRLKWCIRYIAGEDVAPAITPCRLVKREPAAKLGFTVTVIIGRSLDGRFTARIDPIDEKSGGVYVHNVPA